MRPSLHTTHLTPECWILTAISSIFQDTNCWAPATAPGGWACCWAEDHVRGAGYPDPSIQASAAISASAVCVLPHSVSPTTDENQNCDRLADIIGSGSGDRYSPSSSPTLVFNQYQTWRAAVNYVSQQDKSTAASWRDCTCCLSTNELISVGFEPCCTAIISDRGNRVISKAPQGIRLAHNRQVVGARRRSYKILHA